jgi:hypothetical protein
MHLRRGAALLGLALAATAGTVLFSDSPATAAEPPSGWDVCPNGSVCIWKDASFLTDSHPYDYVSFARYIPDYSTWMYRNTNIGSANTATSIINDGISETAYMYANKNKRNLLFSIPRGNSNWALAGDHGDNIESGYYYTYN